MPDTLFNKYGGYATLARVVQDYYAKAQDSDILSPYFDGADMRGLMKHQTEFLGSLMGGPQSYSNQELKQIHRHFDITDTAFNTMMKLMCESLEHAHFEDPDIDLIMDKMRRRRRYIVTPSRF